MYTFYLFLKEAVFSSFEEMREIASGCLMDTVTFQRLACCFCISETLFKHKFITNCFMAFFTVEVKLVD